jgi:aryl-alcohol dehydrogenase-like predicted oxidoreductase
VQRVRFGAGLEITRIVLGCGNFGGVGSAPELFGQGESEQEAFAIMDAAWELGITWFDTADAYGGGRSETAIGKWMSATGHRPSITTKTYNPMDAGEDHGLSPGRIKRQIESSLGRLGVETVDLYLAHEFDPEVPVRETFAAFEALVDRGVIGAWGVSNFDAAQLRDALDAGRPAVAQNSYSLLERTDEEEVLPICAAYGVAYQAYSPLAGGWLTGKYKRGEAPPPGSRMTERPEPYEQFRIKRVFDALDAFADAAAERGLEPAALALAWLLAQPGVTSIVIGPRRPEHLETARSALDVSLSRDEAEELATLFTEQAAR